jgi:hypothetical protein
MYPPESYPRRIPLLMDDIVFSSLGGYTVEDFQKVKGQSLVGY